MYITRSTVLLVECSRQAWLGWGALTGTHRQSQLSTYMLIVSNCCVPTGDERPVSCLQFRYFAVHSWPRAARRLKDML